ncbi:MAG: sigma-70 family RNA polymerase sigma factor [Planctomycetes bacterium]|nr:sigma-70 family RNA polymerase sigma factor [Planctomycetota bacterium]
MTKTSNPDSLLVEEIRQGKPDAWNRLIAQYEGRLLSFVENRLSFGKGGRRAASEDVVQETFIGFLMSLPNYDTRRPLESWLFTIAAHKLTDHLRREGRRPAIPLSTGGGSTGNGELPGRARGASSIARSGERRGMEDTAVAEGIEQQIERWRKAGNWKKIQCLELIYVAGMGNKNVAKELGLSEQRVANFKSDFLQQLRKSVRGQRLNEDVFPELGE